MTSLSAFAIRGIPSPRTSRVECRPWRAAQCGSQICLEINIVPHLLVHLQSVALAIGDDDLIALGIIDHRRREAEPPELLLVLYSPIGLHHIGVGIDALLAPFRHDLCITHK